MLLTQPNLASTSSTYFVLGRSAATSDSAIIGYTHNTTTASRAITFSHYNGFQRPQHLQQRKRGRWTDHSGSSPPRERRYALERHHHTIDSGGRRYLIDSAASNVLKYHNGSGWVTLSGGGGTVSGTTGYISKFTSGSAVGNSVLFEKRWLCRYRHDKPRCRSRCQRRY